MHLILDAHSRIRHPGEVDCLFDSIESVGGQSGLGEAFAFLERSRMFEGLGLAINRDCGSPRELLDDMVGQFGDGGVLCMNVHRNFDLVHHYFPDAKFVHLVRDPRDVARSSVKMGWVGVAYYGVDHWIRAEQSWGRLVDLVSPANTHELKYEDLLEDFRGHVGRLCQFIGVEYESEVSLYHEHSTYHPPDISYAYQWRKVEHSREVELVESKARGLIVGLGYELASDNPRVPGVIERSRLWIANRAYRYRFFIKRYGVLSLLLRRPFELFPWLPGANSYRRRINRIMEKHIQ
jgi:hypothetical protein